MAISKLTGAGPGGRDLYKLTAGDKDGKGADADIIIGGETTAKFVPNVNAKKWVTTQQPGGEAWLNINFPAQVNSETPTWDATAGRVQIDIDDIRHRWYELATGELEYDFVLLTKPSPIKNQYTLNIDFPAGLEFFYQPELTPVEVARGNVRPQNVVGSYAVYWSESNGKYKTGKFCHIYRPHLTDALGAETWADLSIDPVQKKLIITVDAQWLRNATYPVVVDPTLGYSSDGGSSDNTENYLLCTRFQSPASTGDASSFNAYSFLISGSGSLGGAGAGYESSGTSPDASDDKLGDTATWTVTSTTPASYSDTSYTWTGIAASTYYWLAVQGNGNSPGTGFRYDSTTGTTYYSSRTWDGGMPSNLGYPLAFGSFTARISAWVEYGESGQSATAGIASATAAGIAPEATYPLDATTALAAGTAAGIQASAENIYTATAELAAATAAGLTADATNAYAATAELAAGISAGLATEAVNTYTATAEMAAGTAAGLAVDVTNGYIATVEIASATFAALDTEASQASAEQSATCEMASATAAGIAVEALQEHLVTAGIAAATAAAIDASSSQAGGIDVTCEIAYGLAEGIRPGLTLATVTTTLYFPADTAADVSPSFEDAWTYNSEGTRYKLASTKGTSAITVGTRVGPWTQGQHALDRQLVSEPMAAEQVFSTATTVKGQLMVREYAANDNVDKIETAIKVVSEDGTVVRKVLLPLSGYAVAAEFNSTSTHRNKKIADGDALTDTYQTVEGDRLVIEIGYNDTGSATTPEAAAKWGENATDLPENETQTTDGAGWIQFSRNITFVQRCTAGLAAATAAGLTPDAAYDLEVTGGIAAGTAAGLSAEAINAYEATADFAALIAGGLAATAENPYTATTEIAVTTIAALSSEALTTQIVTTEVAALTASADSVEALQGHLVTAEIAQATAAAFETDGYEEGAAISRTAEVAAATAAGLDAEALQPVIATAEMASATASALDAEAGQVQVATCEAAAAMAAGMAAEATNPYTAGAELAAAIAAGIPLEALNPYTAEASIATVTIAGLTLEILQPPVVDAEVAALIAAAQEVSIIQQGVWQDGLDTDYEVPERGTTFKVPRRSQTFEVPERDTEFIIR